MLFLNPFGEPEGIRTPDPWLRRPMLYPTELLTHFYWTKYIIAQIFTNVNENNIKTLLKILYFLANFLIRFALLLLFPIYYNTLIQILDIKKSLFYVKYL